LKLLTPGPSCPRHDKHAIILEMLSQLSELHGVKTASPEDPKMPAILLWLLGVPIPIIILLVLLWH
jgi:hypothetical protein